MTPRSSTYLIVKRALDTLVALVALAILSPVILAVTLLIAATLGRPVFFRQLRPGRLGKPFRLVKFRTMLEADAGRGPVSDGDRLTAVGRWLRATSLDELPTLWNVVRGHMSLVGPRPLLMHYLPLYTPDQARRHEVRPGITGLAQVSGRNALGWEQKFAYDVEYVDQRCLRLDLRIMFATVARVLRREGITADGDPTVPEFAGSTEPVTERHPALH